MELADGGTLFLDEIGHLPLPLQGKLLRALEERTIRRVGGTRSIPFDVRLIAATHVELAAAVKRGEFREDLYYRLNVMPIELPALRERADDVVPLARALPRAVQARVRHAGARALGGGEARAARAAMAGQRARAAQHDRARGAARRRRDARRGGRRRGVRRRRVSGGRRRAAVSRRRSREITQAAARRMLELCGGNKSEAARRLGISRPRLQRLLDATLDQLEGDDEATDE